MLSVGEKLIAASIQTTRPQVLRPNHHVLTACLYPITFPYNGSCSENNLSDTAVFVTALITCCAIVANRPHPASTIKLAQDKREYDPRQSSQETLSKIE